MVEHTNNGITIDEALQRAQEDRELRQTDFLEAVSIDIRTDECRAISAPGLVPARASPSISGSQASQDMISKSQIKKIKDAVRKEGEQSAKRKFAYING